VRAEAFVAAHATGVQLQTRNHVGLALKQNHVIDMHRSLREQATRLRLLRPVDVPKEGSETLSENSEGSPERSSRAGSAPPPLTVDLHPHNSVFRPETPRFAEWPPRGRDSDCSSSHSPSPPRGPRPSHMPPQGIPDPQPKKGTNLYRPVPVRLIPVYSTNLPVNDNAPYREGPGPPFSDRGGRPQGTWSLLHRPPGGSECGRTAGSAPVQLWRGDLRTSGEDLSPGDSSPEEQTLATVGRMTELESRPNWESTGMDYYGEGLGNSRGLREIREARVKRREVTAAHRARRSPRSPRHAALIAALDRQMVLGDEDNAGDEPHVFHVEASSSSPELNEEGYEVVGSSAPGWCPGEEPGRTRHRGSVSDGHQVSGTATHGAPSAFSAYRRPPQGAPWKPYPFPPGAEPNIDARSAGYQSSHCKSSKEGFFAQPQQPKPETLSPRKHPRKIVQQNPPPAVPFKSPSPPVGPPTKALRPPVFVRSRRTVSPVNPSTEPAPCEMPPPRAATAVQGSKLYLIAEAAQPGPSSEAKELLHPLNIERGSSGGSSPRAESPAECFEGGEKDSNGSSGGGSSNDSQGTAGSGSSSGGQQVYGGSGSSSSMGSQHFDSPGGATGGKEPVRRAEGGEAEVRRERGHLDGSGSASNTSTGEYQPAKRGGGSLKEVLGGFVLQEWRHSDTQRVGQEVGGRVQRPPERRASMSRVPDAPAAPHGKEAERMRHEAMLERCAFLLTVWAPLQKPPACCFCSSTNEWFLSFTLLRCCGCGEKLGSGSSV
jgi:hypothetical protein